MQTTPSPSTPASRSVGIPEDGAGPSPDHDIFTDPAITRAVTEDPLFRVLSKNWRQLLVVVAAVLFGSFAWQRFEETRDERLGDYSELYSRASDQLDAVAEKSKSLAELKASMVSIDEESRKKLDTAEKELEDARGRLDDTLKSLGDTAEPYTGLVPLYRGLDAARAGDVTAASSALAVSDWRTAEARGKGAQFAAELSALALARVLIDDEAKFAEGWSALKELSLGASYVYAGAVVTLQRVASTAEQKAEAAAILDQVKAKHPEQADLLRQSVTGF